MPFRADKTSPESCLHFSETHRNWGPSGVQFPAVSHQACAPSATPTLRPSEIPEKETEAEEQELN